MTTINWKDFEKVDIRIGTIVEASHFLEAIRPAIKMKVDFGADIGIKKSSAQITDLYDPETLVGTQVMGVVNFPPKQIGPFMSECLVTGFCNEQGQIVLAMPQQAVPNGARLV